MTNRLTREQLQVLAAHIQGTAMSVNVALAQCGFALDDDSNVESQLLDVDTEVCVGCGWWDEVCMLTYSGSAGGGLCDQCCEDEGIEK